MISPLVLSPTVGDISLTCDAEKLFPRREIPFPVTGPRRAARPGARSQEHLPGQAGTRPGAAQVTKRRPPGRTWVGGRGGQVLSSACLAGRAHDRQQSERECNRHPRYQFSYCDRQSGRFGAGFRRGLQPRQSRTRRCQYVHGDADSDRSDRGSAVSLASNNTSLTVPAFGYRRLRCHHCSLQRHRGSQHRQQSERDCNRHARYQLADRHHQSDGAGAHLFTRL